jgi:hypothetical protein
LAFRSKCAAEQFAVLLLRERDEEGAILAVAAADPVFALLEGLAGAGAVCILRFVAPAAGFKFGGEEGDNDLEAKGAEKVVGTVVRKAVKGFFDEGEEVGILKGHRFADLVGGQRRGRLRDALVGAF